MSVTVHIISRPAAAPGFGLTGLPVREAATEEEAVAALRERMDDAGSGIVLLDETLNARLPDDIRRRLARRPVPLLVPFPGPRWDERREGAESYIVELLRQVIGYRVRLR